MALCRVTGTVYLPNGSLAVNRQIVFRREKKDITAEYLGALFPDDVWQFTNAQGQIDVTLLTGRYVAFAQAPQRAYFGIVTVPDAPTANFADIIGDFEIPEMPPVWYSQALQARDEAVAAADEAESLVSPYDSVAAATAAVKPASVDRVLAKTSWGTVAFLRKTGGPCLGGGWIPDGDVYPDHFLDNVTPGVTNMAAAFSSAFAYSRQVNLAGTYYGVGSTVSFDNAHLVGQSVSGGKQSRIVGLSALLPVNAAVIAPGRTSGVEYLTISYDSLTGSETEGQRVGMDVSGDVFTLQRASWVNQVSFVNVGTAMHDYGVGIFSVSFGSIEVVSFSYAAIHLTGVSRTGSDFGNWYIGTPSSNYTPTYGVCLAGRDHGGSFRQLNIEHTTFLHSALYCSAQRGMDITNLHLEGIDVASAGSRHVYMTESSINIECFSLLNSRASYDDLAVVEFGSAIYDSIGSYSARSSQSYLRIGTFQLKGVSDPNHTIYPEYPVGRRGLNNIPGFTWLRREAGYPNADYTVEIHDHQWASYAGRVDSSIYRNITFSRGLLSRVGSLPEQTGSSFLPYSLSAVPFSNSGHITIGTLTGDITINPPSILPRTGSEISFALTSGAGGFNVSFDTLYKGATPSVGAESQRRIVTFRFDGTYYMKIGDSGWLS